jgi:hypothetical protein
MSARLDDRDCEECPWCGVPVNWGDCRCHDDGDQYRLPRHEYPDAHRARATTQPRTAALVGMREEDHERS